MKTIHEFLARFDHVEKRSNGEFLVSCSGHHDPKPSLSVRATENRILLHCFAGCSPQQILEPLQLTTKDLQLRCNGHTPSKSSDKGKIARTQCWDIVDTSGNLVARHHRIDYEAGKKKMWWERGGKNSLGNLAVKDMPLYGLGWLNEDPGADIVLVEGESCADALRALGFRVVATVCGSGTIPSKNVLQSLTSQSVRVIVWPDNDSSGLKHMDGIAQTLQTMGVDVWVVRWPEAPPGGDVVDFIQNGGDVASLLSSNKHIYVYERDNTLTEAKRDKNVTDCVTNSFNNSGDNLSRYDGLAKQVMDWVKGTSGWWDVRELDSDLNVTGATNKTNRRQILHRLRQQGIIEQHPRINKQFRYVDVRTTSLNFKTAAKSNILPLCWPLDVHKYVNVYPGSVIVVAGSPNAGKTAFMFNVIRLNQDKFPIVYFSSEMGEEELRDRLEQFPGMDMNDWNFQAEQRAENFADVIKPDFINIVDFLEMTTDLYLINTHLTAIHHKLGSGVAIVAVQKKQGATYGRGQEFGLEKPKLYLSMDKGSLKIVKGKSWAMKHLDPNGLQVAFKIVGGCQFEVTRDWAWE